MLHTLPEFPCTQQRAPKDWHMVNAFSLTGLFTHSFHKYSLNVYCFPETVVGPKDKHSKTTTFIKLIWGMKVG